MHEVEQAEKLFAKGFSCSQAVFAAFAPHFGLDPSAALRIAAPFGGGMFNRGDTCGAISGSLMVIGLAQGHSQPSDKQAKGKAYETASQFVARFNSRHGSIVCRDLLGCDLSTPEGMQSARKQGLFRTRCPNFVKDAAGFLEDLLDLQ